MSRYQFIVCKIMQREAYFCAYRSKNIIDMVFMEQGLHNEPDKLRQEVQNALSRTTDFQGRKYDASLLGYGLCSNGIVGLKSEIPLIVPRGHDCMTLLLGSKEKYQQYFDTHRGTYWYSTGWLETNSQPAKERYERILQEYKEKYGDDNAEFLMETEQNWMKEYNWATYIDWGMVNSEREKEYTKKCAEFFGWNYDEIKGDSGLMQRFLDGQWDEKEFLVVPTGEQIAEDLTNEGIIKSQ